MGLFDIFGNSDKSTGNTVLTSYFNEAKNYPEFQFSDYDAWITWASSQIGSDFETFIGNLVNLNYASTTPSDSSVRLATLADQSGGQATIPQITSTAGGSGTTVNWVAGLPQIVADSAADAAVLAANVAQNVGTGVISTLSLVKYLPWILGGAGILYIYSLGKGTGKSFGKSMESLSSAAAERLKKNPRLIYKKTKRKYLSKAGVKRVSKKIAKLRKEGYPVSQAAAIAYKYEDEKMVSPRSGKRRKNPVLGI